MRARTDAQRFTRCCGRRDGRAVLERQRRCCACWYDTSGDVSTLHLLEVGCGAGGNLLELLRFGFAPGNLTGIELLPSVVPRRELLPVATQLIEGDA